MSDCPMKKICADVSVQIQVNLLSYNACAISAVNFRVVLLRFWQIEPSAASC